MNKHVRQVIYEPGDNVSEGDIPEPRDLVEQMYCSQQIHIPPTFPYILRQYCKAAIRTQPYDLLKWSTAYFRAMAAGDVPPVKQRLEYPPTDVPSGLTPGYLRVILRQLKRKKIVTTELLYNKWGGLCLNHNALKEMLEIGEFTGDEVDIEKFVAIAAGHLTDSLKQTMIIICEILTEEPEGGSAMIPFSTFCDLYTFLAKKDCGPPSAHEPDDFEDTFGKELGEVTAEEEESEVRSKDSSEEVVNKEQSSELCAKGIISDIVEKVTAVSPSGKQTADNATGAVLQGGGEQELSTETPETAISEEVVSGSKESDLGHEKIANTVEDTRQHGQGLTAEVQQDESEATETNGKTGENDMHPDEQDSMGEDEQPALEKFKEPPNDADGESTEQEATEDVSIKSEESISTTKSETQSSKTVAKDTIKEIVDRAQVAAEASKIEITAAQFLIKLQSETKHRKHILKSQREHRKLPKPRPAHYEVLGIGPPVSDDQIDNVITYLHYWSARQEGMIMPRNINHFLCPSLDPPPPPEFLESSQGKCTCATENTMYPECSCPTAPGNEFI